MAIISKQDLIDYIQLINTDSFEITLELTETGRYFDLPDLRTGAIHSLVPTLRIVHSQPEEKKLYIQFTEDR